MKFVLIATISLFLSHVIIGAWGYKLGFKDNILNNKHQVLLNTCFIEKQNEKELKEQFQYLFGQCQVLLRGPN